MQYLDLEKASKQLNAMRHTLAMITVDISRVFYILEKKPNVIENAIEHWPKNIMHHGLVLTLNYLKYYF